MTKNLAPVGIPTYTRLTHLQKTIEALQANPLSTDTDLYIYSDGPRTGDEERVNELRAYIRAIGGFKSVNIIEQKDNDFIKNNYGCIRDLLSKHGKIIFMEDDIATTSGFLKFMNEGLNFYKDDKKVLTINGYNIPAKFPKNYRHDYFLSKHYNAWGLGTWQDRGLVEMMNYNHGYSEIMRDKKLYKKIYKIYPALIGGLKRIENGSLDAGDFKVAFHAIKNDMFHIRPVRSLVQNIGFDGTGVHSGTTNRYYVENLSDRNNFLFENLEYDKRMDSVWTNYLDTKPKLSQLPGRIYRKLKKIFKLK